VTDQELIELAAKEVGIKGEWVRDTAFIQARYSFNVPYDNHGMMTSIEWNPLREDSDAMRLAINLGMNLMMLPASLKNGFCTVGVGFSNESGSPRITISENYNLGPYKAVRRAIVRAAAEIGRKMP
jgi:hypothetical protein